MDRQKFRVQDLQLLDKDDAGGRRVQARWFCDPDDKEQGERVDWQGLFWLQQIWR